MSKLLRLAAVVALIATVLAVHTQTASASPVYYGVGWCGTSYYKDIYDPNYNGSINEYQLQYYSSDLHGTIFHYKQITDYPGGFYEVKDPNWQCFTPDQP